MITILTKIIVIMIFFIIEQPYLHRSEVLEGVGNESEPSRRFQHLQELALSSSSLLADQDDFLGSGSSTTRGWGTWRFGKGYSLPSGGEQLNVRIRLVQELRLRCAVWTLACDGLKQSPCWGA